MISFRFLNLNYNKIHSVFKVKQNTAADNGNCRKTKNLVKLN